MITNKIICFKSDTKERKGLFEAASFAHPAKMVLGLQIYLIEHYTKPGDTILDPMAGSGTILMACTLGRNVVLVELEDKFVKMQQDNWDKIKSLGPMLGFTMGKAVILQGDARNLEGLLADNILFSPPYAEVLGRQGWSDKFKKQAEEKHKRTYTKASFRDEDYGKSDGNIGNLPYGEVSAVISSPPYAEADQSGVNHGLLNKNRKDLRSYSYISDLHGKTKGQIGNLKYGKADAILTSPPYEGSVTGKADPKQLERIKKGVAAGSITGRESVRVAKQGFNPHTNLILDQGYSNTKDNIGNLKYSEKDLQDLIDSNVKKCYNLDKCLLEFTLELKSIKRPSQTAKKQNVRQDGQTNQNILDPKDDFIASIVSVKLIEEPQDANRVPYLSIGEENPLAKKLNEKGAYLIQSIKECLAEGILKNHDLKCLNPCLRVGSQELLLVNDSIIPQNGKSGEKQYSREINIPVKYAKQNHSKEKLSILSPIISNELRTFLNWYLKYLMGLHYAENAITKQKEATPNYLTEMLRIYRECHKVLKEKGIMVLVTKNFIRDKKVIRLDLDTIKLCEKAGFKLIDILKRKLTSQSFWRIIYHNKYPDVEKIEFEDILIFEKETQCR